MVDRDHSDRADGLTPTPPDSAVEEGLRRAWQAATAFVVLRGAALVLAAAAGWTLLGLAADWLFVLSSTGWAVWAVAGLAGVGWVAYVRLIRRLQGYDEVRMALRVERVHADADLRSLLVSSVQFERAPPAGVSAALMRAVRRQASQAAPGLDFGRVARFGELRRLAAAAGVLLVGATAAGAVWYATRTEIHVTSGDLRVRRGEPVVLSARASGVVPHEGALYVRPAGRDWRRIAVSRAPAPGAAPEATGEESGTFSFRYEDTHAPLDYFFLVGRARSRQYEVDVAAPPRVVESHVRLDYPDYAGFATQSVETLNLKVPEGTAVAWRLQTDRPVTAAAMEMEGGERVAARVSEGGEVLEFEAVAEASAPYRLRFDWKLGDRTCRDLGPKHYLQVVPDREPRVVLTYPPEDTKATLAKELRVAYRAEDDYGLGGGDLVYSLNKGEEGRRPLDVPDGPSAEGDATWPVREGIADLREGDVLTFLVEVTDRRAGGPSTTPGAVLSVSKDGPQSARSGSRRVQFVSTEEYVDYVLGLRRRYLGQLRPLYMEQLAAVEHVAGLRAGDGETPQGIALEAARQSMVRQRLGELVTRMEHLVLDLRSNPGLGEHLDTHLSRLGGRLAAIRGDSPESGLAAAEAHLQKAMNAEAPETDLRRAAEHIRASGRAMGRLLLEAGVSQAAEVFAIELGEIIQEQRSLRAPAPAPEQSGPLSNVERTKRQRELARRLGRLLEDVETVEDAAFNPLAAVRVARARKLIVRGDAVGLMERAGAGIERGEAEPADAAQVAALRAMHVAQEKLRPEARLETLIRGRDLLRRAFEAQRALRFETAKLSASDLRLQASSLTGRQATVLGPLDALDWSLRLDEPFEAVRSAVGAAAEAIRGAAPARAAERQAAVEAALESAVADLQQRIDEIQRPDRAYRAMLEAGNRLRRLQDLEDRQTELFEEVQQRNAAGENLAPLARLQVMLAKEAEELRASLPEGNRWSPLVGRPLEQAGRHMGAAAPVLEADAAAEASDAMDKTLDAVAEAIDAARREVSFREQLWTLAQLARDLEQLSTHTVDIAAEQTDLKRQTQRRAEGAGGDASGLAAGQSVLSGAAGQVKNLLTSVAEGGAVTPKLDEAIAAMDRATKALEAGDGGAAVGEQDKAQAALAEADDVTRRLIRQTEYLRRIMASMEELAVRAVSLLQRQIALRKQTQAAEPATFDYLAGEQDVLRAEAETFAQLMPVAQSHYAEAAREMAAAIDDLKAPDRDAGVRHQMAAEQALRRAAAAVFAYLEALSQFAEDAAAQEPMLTEAMLDLLTRLLLLATEENELRQRTRALPERDFDRLAAEQIDLRRRTGEVFSLTHHEVVYPYLKVAVKEMDAAAPALQRVRRDEATEHEREAEKALRMGFAAVLSQAYTIETSDEFTDAGVQGPTTHVEPNLGVFDGGSWRTFIKSVPRGEAVRRDRAEWEPLAERERKALNENFIRELPLEYREVLMRYYRILSQE